MENSSGMINPGQVVEIALRYRWFLIVPFCIAMAAGIYLAFSLPKVYEAETLILIEAQRVPTDFVQSIVTDQINDRINTLSQQILSRTNLEKMINQFKLDVGPESSKMFIEDKINALRENISIEVTRSEGRRGNAEAFTISFKGKDPETLVKVVNTLASDFIDENLRLREAHAVGTSDFLEGELNSMRERLEKAEEAMKNYRTRYMGELPEQLESNLNILDRIEDQIIDRGQRIDEAKIRLAEIENQIATARNQRTADGAGIAGVGEGASLDEMKARLAQLKTKYTSRHPDIVRLENMISNMESGNGSTPDTGRQSDYATGVIATYIRQRNEAYREIELMKSEIAELNTQKKIYQQRIENTPKREQELMSLNRDYQNIQGSYNSLLNRKLESEIAVNMEKKQKGERFRILDPAILPKRPIEPDMKKLFLLVVAVGLGFGGGIVFLLEYQDSSFKGTEDVETYLELPVLTTVPPIYHVEDIRKTKLNNIASIFFVVLSGILFVGFAAVAFIGPEEIMLLLKGVSAS